jgi:GntR family transcriptional repressor for pyruvate dehydrogenase complex
MPSSDGALQPVKRTRLYEEVAEQLRGFIDAQGLKPGDRLPPEREIASRLAVSRTSVRQALTALQAIGLLKMRHGEGAYLVRSAADVIPTLGSESFGRFEGRIAVMEVREALETQTSRLAARRRTDAELAEMRRALEDMDTAIARGEDGAVADARFHLAIARASHNEMLLELMEQLAEPISTTRHASLSRPGVPPRSLAAHRAILDAIAAADEELAVQRMREHLAVVGSVP